MKKALVVVVSYFAAIALQSQPLGEWPQWQRDAARTGRTAASVAPPFRARWFWLGPNLTLRNYASNPAWTDDLESREGYSFPVPSPYTVTIAKGVEPVVAAGRVFVGTQEGGVYGIALHDGTTLWSYDMGDAVISTACADAKQVLFADVYGDIVALDAATGQLRWSFTADRTIVTAPLLLSEQNRVFLASHGGTVYCFEWLTGELLWSVQLPAPVQGQLAATSARLFVPAENLFVYTLSVQDGALLAQEQVVGQSFRLTHPVVFGGKLWVTTCQMPMVGSEYIMDDLLAASQTLEEEEALIRAYLRGQTNFNYASRDWQHIFALDTATLDTAYLIANGPVEGVGYPLAGVGITHNDLVVTWFRTRFPTLTRDGPAFGTNFPIDIAAIDPQTGNRIRIDNGRFSYMWPGPEADNLYIFTSGGEYLWLRQFFRGTQVIHLPTSEHRLVMANIREDDGGSFSADVVLYQTEANRPAYAQTPLEGKAAAVIVSNMVLLSQVGGILAIEHRQD
ncbi:MAG: PQQ-binding-like beta-propeller repeat protein [Saprospiraceae bacterium]|nr:PQQ-binding-like beta-propeller repeat protein [Saprospiraceae bacterium]MDW8483893.1 PQQ-binding-like beta-propeller repeat protein [Saprospiraceae bacterium]